MTPPKLREQGSSPDVLSQRVNDLERRVGDLEEADQDREDSNAGIRRDLAAHTLEDAKMAAHFEKTVDKVKADLTATIANVEKRADTIDGKMGMLMWMMIVLIGLGVINFGAFVVTRAVK